jgi:hypothetical protein
MEVSILSLTGFGRELQLVEFLRNFLKLAPFGTDPGTDPGTTIKETLGDAWLNNNRYRYGASALLNDLLRQLAKERTGRYQAPWNFSEASGPY